MILLTGATGFVGHHTVHALLEAKQRVRLLVRTRNHPALGAWSGALASGQLELVEGDLLEAGSLAPAFAGIDTVIHAAALVSFRSDDRLKLLTTNAEGTGRVVDFAREAGVRHLVYVSSTAALGRPPRQGGKPTDELISETTPFVKATASLYGLSKHLGERHVLRGVEEGLSAVIANPGVVIGPALRWRDSSTALIPITDSWLGMTYPVGGNGFVGVNDVARALLRMATGPARMGQRYILVSENLTYNELITRLRRALGRSLPRLPLAPEWALPTAWLAETLLSLVGRRGALTYTAMKTTSELWRYDNRRFREGYEFVFTPLAKVIADTVAAYRAEHPK